MRLVEFTITESMNLLAVKKEEHEKYPEGIWSSVFPREWEDEYDTSDPRYQKWLYDDEYNDEPPKNPKYRPEMNLNLSEENMKDLMRTLGFPKIDDGYDIPIDQFIIRCQQWLSKNIDNPQGGMDWYEEPRIKTPGNIDYTFQKKQKVEKFKEIYKNNEAFVNSQKLIYRDRNIAEPFEEWLNKIISEYANKQADDWEMRQKENDATNNSARFIRAGRRDGYYNENIFRALKIAQEGKKLGATQISAY